MRFLPSVTIAAALAVLTAACGGNTGRGTASPTTAQTDAVTTTGAATPDATSAPTGTPATTAKPADVPEQLRFSVAGIDGAQVVGADYAGKDVAMWFWAPW